MVEFCEFAAGCAWLFAGWDGRRRFFRTGITGTSYADGTMKLTFVLSAGVACVLVACGMPASAASSTKPPKGFERTVVLWPNGAPGAVGRDDADTPKMYLYPAPGAGAHPAVIVLPGGGYRTLSTEKEGGEEARWLNARGVTAFVLQYRLGPKYRFPTPMLDGARAMRYVRSHAAELNVSANKIGLWGFSAGGHLAAYLATMHDGGNATANDPVEKASDRPDFAILSYARLTLDPAIPRKTSLEALIGAHPADGLVEAVSLERHVTKDTSPCFLFSTTEDQTVNSMNSTTFYDALKRAGVPAELHIFEHGRHGSGMAQGVGGAPELAIYPVLIENWMQMHGWMPGNESAKASR